MDTQITECQIYYNCGERQRRKLTKYIGNKHILLLFCVYLGNMAPSTVLVLGHSFVRRLKSDLKFQLDSRMSPSFKLDGTARVYMHGVGGHTVTKLRKYDFGVVARLSPDIVILEIGTNDLSFLPPEVVGSEIEELVSQLQQAYRVKVVCVCLITPRHRNHVFNAKRLILNNYLTVVLEHNKFPNIGRDIEEFVRSRKVGADAWRRTGVLTFDGNTKTGPKATYTRIQKHLEEKYHTKFGYGTIVQLCVVRNKRRLSAKRYKGVAKITCKRARKGFSIRMNPDAHWNTATYSGLDNLQLKDGKDKVIFNRDDASGFRLDTTYTHKQHKGVQLIDAPDTTTRVDYVNKYTSVLQTTSYLFPETCTTPKICVGVVKPHILYQKSPAQHMADLNMLCDKIELPSKLQMKKQKTYGV